MRRALAPVLLALIIAGCDALGVPSREPVACTLIGCDSQLVFELGVDLEAGETYEVEVCLDERCEAAAVEVPPRGAGVSGDFVIDVATDTLTVVLPEADYSGTHTVSLELFVTDVETIGLEAEIEFERLQPNGPGCEPVCWQATVRM